MRPVATTGVVCTGHRKAGFPHVLGTGGGFPGARVCAYGFSKRHQGVFKVGSVLYKNHLVQVLGSSPYHVALGNFLSFSGP